MIKYNLHRKLKQFTVLLRDVLRFKSYADLFIIIITILSIASLYLFMGRLFSKYQPVAEISLSPYFLPQYTVFSVIRGVLAYVGSLLFTIIYAFWAAKDARAGKLLMNILEVLQSVPPLAFMPGLVIIVTSHKCLNFNNFGVETIAIIMIFTGQVWNMILSLYSSFVSVPHEMHEVGTLYHFNWFERLKLIELPFSATGLVWNSMISMAGGWFFLAISENFKLGEQYFRLPGLGSYIGLAVEQQNRLAIAYAIISMIIMIIILDQVIWRPAIMWAQRFRIEDGTKDDVKHHNWLLTILHYSHIFKWIKYKITVIHKKKQQDRCCNTNLIIDFLNKYKKFVSNFFLLLLIVSLSIICCKTFIFLIRNRDKILWIHLLIAGSYTFLRVILSTAIGTLWTLPIGLLIGLSKRLSKIFYPIVQISASFPASILFPLIIIILVKIKIAYNLSCIILMLLATQWYILFNVIAGATTIPNELLDVANSFQLTYWQKLKNLYLPTIFPYLVTGWLAASGGAWNASIIAEYNIKNHSSTTLGLGSIMSEAADNGNYAVLISSTIFMSIIVLIFNKLVWKPCYKLARMRYSLDK